MKLENGEYYIQGINVKDICKEFGTPLYVYDADVIKAQVEKFRKGFEKVDLHVKFACKSLTNINIIKLMKGLGTGLDTVSISEVKMGLHAGFQPDEIVFTPNCVDFSEIEEAVELGVRINIENLSNLEKHGKKYGGSVPVCIRLNPNIHADGNTQKVEWWHKQSKFGIAMQDFDEVKRLEAEYEMTINGIHIHSSSVIMSPEIFLKGAETVFDLAMKFEKLEFIDFGGGIKTDVGDGNEVIDIVNLGEQLDDAFKNFCDRYGKKLQLWFEPGRFLVMDSGTLFTECVVTKNNGYNDFVGINSGFTHLIRPMFYDAYHIINNVSNPQGEEKKYNVVGNICEIDNFAVDRMIPEVKEGDIIAIRNAGAYGYMMASNYNSRPRPAEVLVINGKAKLIRKRDTFDDLMKNQIEIEVGQPESI